jgi:hypothetical protein
MYEHLFLDNSRLRAEREEAAMERRKMQQRLTRLSRWGGGELRDSHERAAEASVRDGGGSLQNNCQGDSEGSL